MKEFLRRSALWAHQLGSDTWPFFDLAALIDPSVRADPELVEQVSKSCELQSTAVQQSCVGALHFAALQESGRITIQLPNPYEPIVSLFENGGGFTLDGTGMIDIDVAASMSRGSLADWLGRDTDLVTRTHERHFTDALLERLTAIKWTNQQGRNAHVASRSRLMVEYLRRASLWAEVLGGPPKWPIFDIAGALAPEVRVDPAVAERVEEFLMAHVGGIETENACRAAVRWATLRDTPDVQLPDLPDPFEPLILLYERGGEVIADESRAFNFGGRRVQIRPWREHHSPQPATTLDPTTLDALDNEEAR
ncbi:hypothetical protein [Kitasatospora sp. NPDC058190]|uniref:hypothetical protein n=1 Tax=Kitasatospora sp. NPDC058190 TaxID=3346371 RepID=UPI0036DA1770